MGLLARTGGPRRLAALVTCALACAAAGCGGGDEGDDPADTRAAPTPGAQQPTVEGDVGEATAALESFLRALAEGDAEAACALLSRRGREIVEEGALIGSPSGGGECEEVVVESYGSPDESVYAGLRVYGSERSSDGSLRLRFANAATPITGAVTAVLRREGGEWRVDSTGLPRRQGRG